MDLTDMIALLERDYRINGRRSQRNLRNYRRRLLEHLPATAEAISVGDVERYKDMRLDEEAATSTINSELSALRKSFRLAIEQELFMTAPPHIKNLVVDNTREGFVEPEEFRRLHFALRVLDEPVADAILWLYHLGWRRSEALEMTWPEIDRTAGMVQLPRARSKNRQPRRIPLPRELAEMIERRWSLRMGDYVFHRRGDPVRYFRTSWWRATAAIGRSGLYVHDLRRSFARNALQAGVPEAVIMQIGGWKTRRTFLRYCIIDERPLARGVQALEEFSDLREVSC